MIRRNALLVTILIVQICTFLVVMEIGDDVRAIRRQPAPVSSQQLMLDKLAELRGDLTHLTHPETMTRRMIQWGNRSGEFEGVK